MTPRPTRALSSVLLALALLALAGSPAFAAKAKDADPVTPETTTTEASLTSAQGKSKSLRVAKAKVAKDWARFRDPIGDQVGRDGNPAEGAEPWTDLTDVFVVNAGAAHKMLRVLDEDYPPGTAGGYYGVDADWQPTQNAFYVIARTLAKIPRSDDTDLQLIVTFDGPDGVPHEAGSVLGPYDGAQTFSLSGPFPGRGWETGTTDLSAWDGTEPIPFFNGPSRDMGYYDFKRGQIVHVAGVPKGATAATVTLRAGGPDGSVFDEIRLPSGGRFIGLESPAWGLNIKKARAPLACRSVATFSAGAEGAEELEPGMHLIRYSVGWDEASDIRADLLALDGTVELALTAVGSEDEPQAVDALVDVNTATDSATFSVVVPDGQWMLGATEATPLRTAAGQSIVDLRPLTGSAGLATAPGLDGFVAGDAFCNS